jgi:hypothetical protein
LVGIFLVLVLYELLYFVWRRSLRWSPLQENVELYFSQKLQMRNIIKKKKNVYFSNIPTKTKLHKRFYQLNESKTYQTAGGTVPKSNQKL